jgi:hypothetical protein
MSKFQVQYKNNSQTFTDILPATSYKEIVDLFQDLINAEILEIRKVVYEDNTYPKDDGNYKKNRSMRVYNEKGHFITFKLPKIKKSLNDEDLTNLSFQYLRISNNKPYKILIK